MKKIFLISFLAIFLFQLTLWFSCRDFKNVFHFSSYGLKLEADNLIHNDINLPLPLIRFYHNKITLFIIQLSNSYLLFWDVKFLSRLISLTGIFGLLCAVWYARKILQNNKYVKFIILLMLVLPFLEIIFSAKIFFPVKIILLSLPVEIFSLLGLSKFLEQNRGLKTYIFLVLIVWFSIWWQTAFPTDFRNYCS